MTSPGDKAGSVLSALYGAGGISKRALFPGTQPSFRDRLFLTPVLVTLQDSCFREICRPVCDIWSHRFKVREWDGGREHSGVPEAAARRAAPATQSYFLATLEGLGGRADEHPAVPCKLSVNFCPLSVPICHYQTMMRTRWTMPVWERPGKGTPAAQWKQGQYRPSPGRFPGIYSN